MHGSYELPIDALRHKILQGLPKDKFLCRVAQSVTKMTLLAMIIPRALATVLSWKRRPAPATRDEQRGQARNTQCLETVRLLKLNLDARGNIVRYSRVLAQELVEARAEYYRLQFGKGRWWVDRKRVSLAASSGKSTRPEAVYYTACKSHTYRF